MERAVRERRPLRRAAALGLTALLWAGLTPAQAAAGGADPVGRAYSGAAPPRTARVLAPDPGQVVAWGSNEYGQVGDASTVGATQGPVAVCGAAPCPKALGQVIAVEAGYHHSVALAADGTVWAWGSNATGQLGDGTYVSRRAPVRVGSLTGVTALSAGRLHTLALRSDGTVWAWGYNGQGQLGNGTTTGSNVPVQVCAENTEAGCTSFLTGVTSLSAGYAHSLAVGTRGGVRAWGDNRHGALGDGTTAQRLVPVPSLLTSGVRGVAAGLFFSLGAMTDGTARGWGQNFHGHLGDGTTTDRTAPVRVCAVGTTAGCTAFLGGVASVAAGEDHGLAVLSDGGVRAWGRNSQGQLGDGTTTDRYTPVRVCGTGTGAGCTTFLGGATAVDAGFRSSLTRHSDGTARLWGTGRTTPNRLCAAAQTADCARPLEGVGSVTAGFAHSLAVVLPRADLRVTIAPDASVASGDGLTYTITVRNDGPAAADDVVLDGNLPGEGRFVSASPSQGSCTALPRGGSSDTVSCALGRVAAHAQATVTVRVAVRAPSGSTVTHTATVGAATPDPDPSDNTASLRTTVG
ncbi:hypothetical protein [Streptomyces sp. NPDC008121]|uniref:RCC1 domain-containing protein n=1 Tax=Streptomyces sp. NPDC008121 TaxID=3364809 RepID=UPI0036EC1E3A